MDQQLDKVTGIIKKIASMPAVEIDITEWHKSHQSHQRIQEFETQHANTVDKEITHRYAGAGDMGAAKHQPPEKNKGLTPHNYQSLQIDCWDILYDFLPYFSKSAVLISFWDKWQPTAACTKTVNSLVHPGGRSTLKNEAVYRCCS
jgi:hypothetical protein